MGSSGGRWAVLIQWLSFQNAISESVAELKAKMAEKQQRLVGDSHPNICRLLVILACS